MAQSSAIAMWLMLIFKVAIGLMAFLIVMLCLFWAIRHLNSPKTKDMDLG